MMAGKLGKCLMAVLMLAILMAGSSCGRPDEASSQYEMTSVEEVGDFRLGDKEGRLIFRTGVDN